MRVAIYLPNELRCFTPSDAQVRALAAQLPECELVHVRSEPELLSLLPSCDAAVVWSFSSSWYAGAPRLAHVFTPAAGRERLEPDPHARVRAHHGAFHGAVMAESLLAMLLFMSRRLGVAVLDQKARLWERQPFEDSQPLAGQSVLLIGYGAIARHAAPLLAGLGMRVYGLKRDAHTGTEGAIRVFSPKELHAALALADHAVCILPGDTGTSNLIGERELQAMKKNACLYNLGRGNAIDLSALARALREGRLAGAFLDVLPEEPPRADSPAFDVPNLFLTPHASAIRRDYLDLYFAELAPRLSALCQRLS